MITSKTRKPGDLYMRTIKIWYTDFWGNIDFETYLFTRTLRKHFNVILDKDNPEYLFCSTSGNDYLRYKCIRILFLGEAKCPDFNLYDYAIGFDDIIFEDRYLRYPLCLLDKEKLKLALNKHKRNDVYYLNKRKFCNFVVSAGGGFADKRTYLLEKINEYKRVDSGGRYKNNLPDGQPVKDKLKFQEMYKFSLALENTRFRGYTTEKIIDAWAAGTIPIYWGDPYIKKEFNAEAFIDASDYDDTEKLIDAIREIEEDENKYLQMMKAPIITKESVLYPMLEEEYLDIFLNNIVSQKYEEAFRRNSALTMFAKYYEHHIMKWKRIEDSKLVNTLREAKRKLVGLEKI